MKPIDFRTLLKIRPAGFRDNAALLSIAGGAMASNPLVTSLASVSPTLAGALGAAIASVGGSWIGQRAAGVFDLRVFDDTKLKINSDIPPRVAPGGGMLLGYCSDSGRPIIVPWDDWMRHAFILGQSGVGKTVMGEWIMTQQILMGGGVLWIDGKLDPDNLAKLRAICAWAGREDDLLVINPGDPSMSNTYNPILYGDADEVASRVISLIPSAENNPGADYFRQAALQGVTTLVKAIQKTGRAYNFIDLTILLQNQRALAWLENLVPSNSSERKELSIFLEQYKTVDKNGMVSIDIKRLKDTFGGIGGRMHQFGSGNFGIITNSYTPEVNLFDAVRLNKIVYVALPTMGKQEAAANFGKLVVGDFRTAISWVQALPKEQRPWPPYLGFFDEAGSYVTSSWARIFEQARSAHLMMLPAVQTEANLEVISKELRAMVEGNTWTKMFFKPGETDTGESVAEMIGKEARVKHAINFSAGAGHSEKKDLFAPGGNRSGNRGFSYSESDSEEYKVSPTELKRLDKGECIVTIGGSDVHHAKVPRIEFEKAFLERLGPPQINRFRPRFARGLDLFRDVDRWLTTGE